MRLRGLLRPISNRLFVEGRNRQKQSRHKTTTDCFSARNAEPPRDAIPPASMPVNPASIPLRELAVKRRVNVAFFWTSNS